MKNKTLVNFWTLLIGTHLNNEYSIECDHALDMDIHPIDKDTCIVVDTEVGTITIYNRSGTEISGAEMEAPENSETWRLLSDIESW